MSKRKSPALQLDGITEDGILRSIISSFTLRDAVRTSVLSRRWRHIWTYHPYLHFHADNMLEARTVRFLLDVDQIAFEKRSVEEFVRSVDSVLHHHQGVGVEEFEVSYFLNKSYAHVLDRWVHFAFASKTKNLVLHLAPEDIIPFNDLPNEEPYNVPCQLFTKHYSSSIEFLSLNFCLLKPPREFDGLKHLRELILESVEVTEEDIRHLLCNCSALERLHVSMSNELMNLTISHPLSQLNYLSVNCCFRLNKIVLDAVKLMTLEYTGNSVDFIFIEVPQLTEARIDFEECPVHYDFTTFAKKLPPLKTLSLKINDLKVTYLPYNSSLFFHLKHLELIVDISYQKDFLPYLASFLNAAPFMEKFELHRELDDELFFQGTKKIRRLPRNHHIHLKKVEITGFVGTRWQIEIAVYLLSNATELELMTITSRYRMRDVDWDSEEEVPKEAIEYISREVPTKVSFVYL